MSIVGNRPLPLYEAELLTSDAYIDRFMAPSGLTGLWQVEKRGGAGKMSAEERKQLDIKYAQEFCFRLDMKILLRTFTRSCTERERVSIKTKKTNRQMIKAHTYPLSYLCAATFILFLLPQSIHAQTDMTREERIKILEALKESDTILEKLASQEASCRKRGTI